jgi:hypothetical protein
VSAPTNHVTGADAVSTTSVVLNLLECQSQGFAEFLLSHPEYDAARAGTTPDMLVDRIKRRGRRFRRLLRLLDAAAIADTLRCSYRQTQSNLMMKIRS